jgi:ribosomal protein S24E
MQLSLVKMEVIKDFKNGLLKRREVKVVVKEESNPGFTKALQIISEEFKAPEENIVMRGVGSKFGRNTFLIDAFIYDSVEDKKRIERIKDEPKAAEEGKAEAAPAAPFSEEKAEEAKVEEKVEEKKGEAKE